LKCLSFFVKFLRRKISEKKRKGEIYKERREREKGEKGRGREVVKKKNCK